MLRLFLAALLLYLLITEPGARVRTVQGLRWTADMLEKTYSKDAADAIEDADTLYLPNIQ